MTSAPRRRLPDRSGALLAAALVVALAAGVVVWRTAVGDDAPAAAPAVTPSTTAAGGGPTTASPSASGPTGPGIPARPGSARPTEPPARVCGNAGVLDGPATPPPGALTVPAGDNGALVADGTFSRPGVTFWFAPGAHTLGDDAFAQIIPGDGATFVGAPGAVLDGRRKNLYAFTQTARDVTIEHLTIRGFGTGRSNNDEGVVNHDRGAGWTVRSSTLTDNDGAALMLGSGSRTSWNCLSENGQYGFSAFAAQGDTAVRDVVLDHNEIWGNNTDDWERLRDGCGCTGGGKLWATETAVLTANYVHDNRGAGLWADTNNRDVRIEGNWIEGNDNEAVFYEVSFNFRIADNVMLRNAIVKGRQFQKAGDSFPVGAVYVSEAGGDARAGDRFARSEIVGNYLRDNWDGVVLWENADRFCRPADEDGDVTATCPWFRRVFGERFRTQNVAVRDNDFVFSRTAVGCTSSLCGRNAVFSNYGTWPENSPYKGDVVQSAVTFAQRNVWRANRYTGPWHFTAFDASRDLTADQWRAAPYRQDAGSTFG